MTTQFKINLQELDIAFLQRLKEQYADAMVEINIQPIVTSPLQENEFWTVIKHI